jgi:hypothetical protein
MMSLSSSVNKTNEYYSSMIKIFPYHKQPTASYLSIDYLGKHGLWSQERKGKHFQTIICDTRHYTLMVILDISETWNNDHNPTFRESYLEDDNGKILVSGNAPYEIKGNGNCIIIGHEDALGASKNFGDGH